MPRGLGQQAAQTCLHMVVNQRSIRCQQFKRQSLQGIASQQSLGFTKLQSDQQTFGAAQLETGTEPIPFNRNEFLRFLETNQKSPRSAKRNSRNLSPSHSCPDIRSGIELLKQLPKHEDRSEVSPTRSASLDDEPIRQFNQTKPLPIPTRPQAHNIIQKGVCVRNPHT